jgi:hypothetical protein
MSEPTPPEKGIHSRAPDEVNRATHDHFLLKKEFENEEEATAVYARKGTQGSL